MVEVNHKQPSALYILYTFTVRVVKDNYLDYGSVVIDGSRL